MFSQAQAIGYADAGAQMTWPGFVNGGKQFYLQSILVHAKKIPFLVNNHQDF